MPTSPMSILSEIEHGNPISLKTRAFYRRRFQNLFHRLVVRAFRETGLNQKQLADRIDSQTSQVNRWLGIPGNWTLNTISDLLLGMGVDLDDPSFVRIADLLRNAEAGNATLAAPAKSGTNDKNNIISMFEFLKKRSSRQDPPPPPPQLSLGSAR
jgi:hypothetical protein